MFLPSDEARLDWNKLLAAKYFDDDVSGEDEEDEIINTTTASQTTDRNTGSPSNNNDTNVGLIVGLSIGILLLVLAAALLFYFRQSVQQRLRYVSKKFSHLKKRNKNAKTGSRAKPPADQTSASSASSHSTPTDLINQSTNPPHSEASVVHSSLVRSEEQDKDTKTGAIPPEDRAAVFPDDLYLAPIGLNEQSSDAPHSTVPAVPDLGPPEVRFASGQYPFGGPVTDVIDSTIVSEFNRLEKPVKPHFEASKPENVSQNRFMDVLPFDENRVKLSSGKYINASVIEGGFIATQDPQQTTEDDDLLWSMVWEYGVNCIVRLSADTKTGLQNQVGSAPYLPLTRRWVFENGLEVSIKEERVDEITHITTTVTVQKTEGQDAGERQVVHYHLKNWNQDRPPKAINFLRVLRMIKNRKRSIDSCDHTSVENKVLVHCGAGANRSGAFIAVWQLMDEVDSGNLHPDVFSTVQRLRNQRMLAVQRIEMYNYVHECINLYAKDWNLFNEDQNYDKYEPEINEATKPASGL